MPVSEADLDALVERLMALNEQNRWPSLSEAATAIATLRNQLTASEAREREFREALEIAADELQACHDQHRVNGSEEAAESARATLRNPQVAARPEPVGEGPFTDEEHSRYDIRDDAPPTVHSRWNEHKGRWETPCWARKSVPNTENHHHDR